MDGNFKKIEYGPEAKESKERFGRNVKIHAIFVRHGEKEISPTKFETGLTERGKKESKEFAKKLKERKTIKAFSSDTERTKETAKLIVEASPTEKKMKQRVKKELGFYYDPEGGFVKKLKEIKKEILGENFDRLPEKEQKERFHEYEKQTMDYYLGFGNKRPDPNTFSPVETAAMIARRLDIYLRMPEKLYSDSEVDLINVSHDFPLVSFLKEVLIRKVGEKQIRGFGKIDEIGGPIGLNEGFEVLIQTDNQGEESLKMIFRNQEYRIDMERLKELVEIAKSLEEKEKE
jgi:broad specificity phosphatase PhoE